MNRRRLFARALPGRAEIVAVMNLVNDHWIGAHADPGSNNWDRSTYFSGLMAHFRTTSEQRLLDYAVGWAERHSYGLIGGVETREPNNHCVGQVYLDLYEELGGEEKIADIEASLSAIASVLESGNEDWWAVDALHMGMPPFARIGALRGDNRYWIKMYRLYHYCKRRRGNANVFVQPGNLSESAALWYRDQNFQVDGSDSPSPNGLPVHWSRGNGWAIAAHAKVLKTLPHNDKRGPEYIYTLQRMAAALRQVQRSDGFWNVNLADPDHFGGPETSGTALFTFGIAYGINAGLLDRATYEPVVTRAWNGMVATAVQDDGFLGYVQPVADRPDDGQPVGADDTTDYGVGAFLLAGAELAALDSSNRITR